MTERIEDQLVERARSGDSRALEALLQRHEAQVYRFSRKMCGDPEDAKDAAQDTLLTLARRIVDFRGASSLSTWLYTVARSFCAKKRRRSKFAPSREQSLESEVLADDLHLADAAPGPEDQLQARNTERVLDAAIAALEPKYREALVLRDIEGLTAPEAAEVMGISVQAVKSRLHRARLAVRTQIAPLLDLPDTSPPSADCPDAAQLLSQHLEGDLSPDVCADMERHIESCGRCRGACLSLRRSLALCRHAGEDTHVPPAVQASVRSALRSFLAENA